MVKEQTCCSVSGVVEGRHGFGPLGEVIDCNDDVFVFISIWRVGIHEVYAPFEKGVGSNDWVEKRRWFSRFVGI
jgi:hypothetical protein